MTSPSTDRRLGLSGGVAFKAPVDVATTTNITLSGEQTIDGVLTSASDVLVKNQTTASQNGIYTSDTGAWSRRPDFNGTYDAVQGTLVYVAGGSISAGLVYQLTTANPVIGTSSLTFTAGLFSGLGTTSFIQTGTGAIAEPAQTKMRDIVGVRDFGAVFDGSSHPLSDYYSTIGAAQVVYPHATSLTNEIDWAATQAAINLTAISNAKATVSMPQGVGTFGTMTLTMLDRVKLHGSGYGGTFLNYTGTGTFIGIDGISYWELRDFRIGYGSSATIVGINITAGVSTQVQFARIKDVLIVGNGAGVAGQKGIVANSSGGSYIQNSNFDLAFFYVDKPIERTNTETCVWNAQIAQFGFTASGAAINGTSNDDVMTAHVGLGPGLGGGNNIAYTQHGNSNIDFIVADIQAGGNTALAISGVNNTITLSRPTGLTPLGTINTQNTLFDRTSSQVNFGPLSGSKTSKTWSDYEEGTWTPTQGAGLTLVGAFSSSGTYTKTGRKVVLLGQINGATTVAYAAAGSALVGGAPFAQAGNIGTGTAVNLAISAGANTIISGSNIYADTNIGATATIYFSVTYFV